MLDDDGGREGDKGTGEEPVEQRDDDGSAEIVNGDECEDEDTGDECAGNDDIQWAYLVGDEIGDDATEDGCGV